MRESSKGADREEGSSGRTEYHHLHLPPPEEVSRVLDLEESDDESLHGLVRLNVIRAPALRFAGLNVLFLVALAHNALLGLSPVLLSTTTTLAIIEIYALGSWAVLWAFFARVRSVHLGAVFLVADLLIMDVVLLYSGGAESLLWPIFILRVGDQLFAGRGRALGMVLAGLVSYGLLLLLIHLTGQGGLDPVREVIKVLVLAGIGGYLVLSARLPLGLQDRALKAKELILQLEEQSLALNQERLRAEEASRVKSEFLARMSHELRTPMNSVIGFTNVLLRSDAIPAESREAGFLHRIRENGVHLMALINDVLDIYRIEEGRLQIEFTEIDVTDLINGTVAQLEDRAIAGAVAVVTEMPEGPFLLRADEIRLRQVLINLLGNALKFTAKGTVKISLEVEVETRKPLAIHVQDTGPGIDPGRISEIFHPFEQEDGSLARRHGGTGLGLAISRTLCTLMGFEVRVQSAVGEGSTFSVLLDPESPQEESPKP